MLKNLSFSFFLGSNIRSALSTVHPAASNGGNRRPLHARIQSDRFSHRSIPHSGKNDEYFFLALYYLMS